MDMGNLITLAIVAAVAFALITIYNRLVALRTRAGFASIRAPMAGVVTERLVETGDIVSPNQRLGVNTRDRGALYLLAKILELTAGASLKTNIALVENNARLAANVAAALPAGRQV